MSPSRRSVRPRWGLWRLMQRLGLSADMFAGHSYGEFVALHAAGAFDFDALMNLSAARGRYIVDAAQAAGSELGTMAAVQATRKAVEGAIAGIEGVIVANHNAPLQCILSGTRAAVAQASQTLRDTGIEVTDIPVAAAFHSVLVRPAQAALAETITATPWQPLRVPVYSNARAEAHGADVEGVRRAMADHLVQPVEFVAEVQAMADDGARVFVEVGPKSVLTRLVGKILEGRDHVAVALDDGQGLSGLLKGLAQLACAGVPLQWSALFEGRDCRLGDPTDLANLQRLTVLPRHAWLLNGSRARRAGEPAQQIGVTVEDVAALTGVAGPTPRGRGYGCAATGGRIHAAQ
jgi:acyl transferase domain-containing protein